MRTGLLRWKHNSFIRLPRSAHKNEKTIFLFKLRRRLDGSALAVVSTRDGNKRAAVVTLSLQVLHFFSFYSRFSDVDVAPFEHMKLKHVSASVSYL